MAFLLIGLICLTAGFSAQGEENVAPEGTKARSEPYIVLGLQPPTAEISNFAYQAAEPQTPNLLDVLVRGVRSPHHEPGHTSEHDHQHEHGQAAGHDHHEHQKTDDKKTGDPKSRQKRGYCSRCGGQIGYGGGGLGGYGGGYGGGLGGYGGGCGGGGCGGGGYGRPVYQQPIYQQPIYGGGGGYCNTCGSPYGGGGRGQSYSSSSAQSSSSSFGYGRK